jgi:hypothetical protein
MKKIFLAVIMAATLLLLSSGLQGNLQYWGENNVNRVKSLGHIVFSEVLYDSWVSGEDEGEWLELYNPTGSAMNIGGWTISDNNENYSIPNGTSIAAYGFLIISKGSSAFSTRYGFYPGLSNFFLDLSNSGDFLILKNSSGTVIDQVAWKSGGLSIPGWGSSSSPYADESRSIMRSNLNQDTDTYLDWLSNRIPDPQSGGITSPQIHLDKTLMTFSLAEGNDSDSDTFTISNSGIGTLNWSVSGNRPWISVNPTWGQDTGIVTVTVSSSGLTAGSYTGEITVSDVNASNSPQKLNVSLTVTGSGGPTVPQIHLDKTSMTFSLAEGNDSDSDTFTISNSGTGTLNWSASGNRAWISVNPTWGQDTGIVTVTVSSSGLTAGSYTGEITVSDVNASNSPQKLNVSLTITGSGTGDAIIQVNRENLYFGSIGGIVTGAQTLMITNPGEGDMNWTISKSSWQLDVSPNSGTNAGIVTVTVDPADLKVGVYYGTLTIKSPDAVNSPKTVYVFLTVYDNTSLPFGEFATPAQGTVLSSSIPVTGWVLDDIDVINVKIYCDNNYIGDAVFVDGARPDVEQAFPYYPKNYQAGWGYMMLSNFLPNGGNGIYTITAKVTDAEGNVVTLGSKTVTIDNANAVKPFGALDTPTQGGTASGSNFINWGWVLTPQPNFISIDGSTINVYVDGVNLGNPVYNIYRSDIASLFPGYANSEGAGGYFSIDTTGYSSGLHTISWTASDSAVNIDGLGSRYFTIINSSTSNSTSRDAAAGHDIAKIPLEYSPILIKHGVNGNDYLAADMNDSGDCIINIKELEPMEILLTDYINAGNPDQRFDGYLLAGNRLKALPAGSTLDRSRGIFYWMPGIGYYGEYRFIFVAETARGRSKKYVTINITPKN